MRSLSPELAAVLHLFSHDEELRTKALPHVDAERRLVNWPSVFESDYGSGHAAAVLWAYSLWTDTASVPDPFSIAFSMDAGLRRAVIRALAIRWSIPIDGLAVLRVA